MKLNISNKNQKNKSLVFYFKKNILKEQLYICINLKTITFRFYMNFIFKKIKLKNIFLGLVILFAIYLPTDGCPANIIFKSFSNESLSYTFFEK